MHVQVLAFLAAREVNRVVSASASHYTGNWPTSAIEIRQSATSRNELAIKQQFDDGCLAFARILR